jgi:hypothetical protein
MQLKAVITLASLGGFPVASADMPIEIVAGTDVELFTWIKHCDDSPAVITYHNVSLRIRKADNSVLEIIGTPWDNNNGCTKFTLTGEQTAAFMVIKKAATQAVEVVTTHVGGLKTYIAVPGALLVRPQILV